MNRHAPQAPQRISATFDGEPIEAEAGASVAAALLASGRPAWRTTRDGQQRGLFCGIGICFDCLVTIDGESGQRACMIPLAEGMTITSAVGAQRAHGDAANTADDADAARGTGVAVGERTGCGGACGCGSDAGGEA